MRRRVVSVLVGLAVGAVVYLITGRYVSYQVGPLIVGAGAAVLAAMGMSELWRACARKGRVIDAAIADALRPDHRGQGPGGGGPVVTRSADATVVYDLDRLRIQIIRPRGWRGQHRRTSKAGAR